MVINIIKPYIHVSNVGKVNAALVVFVAFLTLIPRNH